MKRHAHTMVTRSQKEMKLDPNPDGIVTKGPGGSTIIKTIKGKKVTYGSAPDNIKKKGDKLYSQGKYDAAASEYTRLIGLEPSNEIYYGNRAACYLMMNNYETALKDAKKSVEINPNFIKGHSRVIKCAMALHEIPDMIISVEKLKVIDPTNEVLKFQSDKMEELANHLKNEMQAYVTKNYPMALLHINKCLEICPEFVDFKLKKAEHFVHLRNFIEAEKISNEVLERNDKKGDAHYILGMCFYQTDIDKSVNSFREAFRLNPASGRDRELFQKGESFLRIKNDGNVAFKAHHYTRAHQYYLEASCVDPQNTVMQVTLYSNMAIASYKLGLRDRCIKECNRALAIKPNHVKALVRRSQCYMDQKKYAEAIADLEKAERIDSSPDTRRMLQEARRLLERSKNDFHVILEVSEGATLREVTDAYRRLTRLHHPDRHANATDDVKKYHETKCKEITRAYRLLKDQKGWNYCSNNNNNFDSHKKPSQSPRQQEHPKQSDDHDEDDQERYENSEDWFYWQGRSMYCKNCDSQVFDEMETCNCRQEEYFWDGTESQDGYYNDFDDYY